MSTSSIAGSTASGAGLGFKLGGPVGAGFGAMGGLTYGMLTAPTTHRNPGSLSPGTGSAYQDFFYTKLFNQMQKDGQLPANFQYGMQLPGSVDPNNPFTAATGKPLAGTNRTPSSPLSYTGTNAALRPGSTDPRTVDRSNPFNLTGSPYQNSGGGAGGFGGSDINYDAIRERAIAPSRAVYQNAIRNLQRQPGMGFSSPGFGAQMLALSRGQSQATSDAATKAEAEIAEMKLRERALAQEGSLRSRALDISEKQLPSSLDRGLNTTGQILDLVGRGAGMYGTIMDAYGGNSGGSVNDTIDRLMQGSR